MPTPLQSAKATRYGKKSVGINEILTADTVEAQLATAWYLLAVGNDIFTDCPSLSCETIRISSHQEALILARCRIEAPHIGVGSTRHSNVR